MTDMANHDDDRNDDEARVVSFAAAQDEKRRALQTQKKAEHQPILRLPPAVKILCAVIAACFLAQQVLPADLQDAATFWGGFIPARYSGGLPFGLSALWTPFTYMFLHGGWMHLGINLGMLMAFGAGLELQRGPRVLMLVFVGSGIGGALLQLMFFPHDMTPMVGASGGISGLFGAALMEMVNRNGEGTPLASRMRQLLPFAAVWVVISVFFGMTGMPGEDQPVAWAAHIGGFFAGLALAAIRPRPPRTLH